MSSIEAIARETLAHEDIRFAPDVDPSALRTAVANLGVGLDHFVGEVVVALVDQSRYAEVGSSVFRLDGADAAPFEGAILTDRRLVGGSPPRAVPLDSILGASLEGSLVKRLDLSTLSGAVGFELDAAEALHRFIEALLAIPPGARTSPPRPLVHASPLDPTGAAAGMRSLRCGDGDPRPRRILSIVQAAHRAGYGVDADGGIDLTARAVLLDRTLATARGMHDGQWISPLEPADLAHAAATVLGQPLAGTPDSRGGLDVKFRFWGGGDRLRGFEEILVHLRIVPLGTYGGFTVRARSRGLDQEDLAASLMLHDGLPPVEARLLLMRALYGWKTPAEQLLAYPLRAVADRMRALVGEADLSEFVGSAAAPSGPSSESSPPPATTAVARPRSRSGS